MPYVVVASAVVVGLAVVIWTKLSQLKQMNSNNFVDSQNATPSATSTAVDQGGPWRNGPVVSTPVPAPTSNVRRFTSERLTLHANAPPERTAELQKVVDDAAQIANSTAQMAGTPVASPQELVSAVTTALKNVGVTLAAPGAGIPLTIQVNSGPNGASPDPAKVAQLDQNSNAISLSFPGGLSDAQIANLAPRISALIQDHPEIKQALQRGDTDSAQSLAQSLLTNALAADGIIHDSSATGRKVTVKVKLSMGHQ